MTKGPTSSERIFPVLGDPNVRGVPWRIVEPHRKQAMTNHDQTLERLAERGGLSLDELVAVISGEHWHDVIIRKPK
ncbi:hypothetical protein LCGC14_2536710 [marine sediment metagenome]|uniref:Uncharacterized protein n=1 Tax=marine sediment metagenome TaxID=412755 RepID=A0A0F9ARY8_9ZZZZ